jgi:hypothetical protein
VGYAVENALFQWEDGARRLREAPPGHHAAVEAVLDELRRRLGSTFELKELAALYGEGVDWALDAADRRGAAGDAAWIVDAAFHRYAREASDYAGGRRRVVRD